MLPTVMTKEIIATREAFGVVAAGDMAVIRCFGRILLYVLPLMTSKVFRVDKSLIADRTSVRPLVTTEMNLEMAAGIDQSKLELSLWVHSL